MCARKKLHLLLPRMGRGARFFCFFTPSYTVVDMIVEKKKKKTLCWAYFFYGFTYFYSCNLCNQLVVRYLQLGLSYCLKYILKLHQHTHNYRLIFLGWKMGGEVNPVKRWPAGGRHARNQTTPTTRQRDDNIRPGPVTDLASNRASERASDAWRCAR